MNRKKALILGGIAASIVVLFGGGVAGAATYYKDKYYPGTRISGTIVGGKRKEDVQKAMAERVAKYQNHPVVVTLPDISKERLTETGEYPVIEIQTTAEKLGLSFDTERAQNLAWEVGHTYSVGARVKSAVHAVLSGKNIPLVYQVDPKGIDAFINTEVSPRIITPTPAKIVIDGDKVTIEDAKPGLAVDTGELAKSLASALPNVVDGDSVFLKAPVATTDSNVTRDTLSSVAAQLDQLANQTITLDNNGTALKPTRVQLLSWYGIVQDDSGKVGIGVEKSALEEFIKTKGGKQVDVTKSYAAIDKILEASIAAVTKDPSGKLSNQSVALTQKPEPEKTELAAGNYTPGRFEGKYVEVNLKEQKLYRINGSTLEKVYRISSGKWSTPTPRGTFTITSKHPRAYSKTYGLYMPYWQNFLGTSDSGEALNAGEYGLHELPEWPSGYKEGQAHLGTAVSHGCVRLGVGDAKEIYEWTEVGTPVVIY